MNIRLLGTGGADGIPGLFADNRVSRAAREHGGKDVRSRAAAIVDGCLKIDLGPDTHWQMVRNRLSSKDWTALIFTHGHEDHLCPSEIQYALYPFVEQDHLPFSIYGNAAVLELIRSRYPDWPLDLVTTRSFLTYTHGPYRITPVAAFHDPSQDCHNLLIERGGKTLLYATDTGWWLEDTFRFLESFCIDAMVIECTDGLVPSGYEGHLDVARAAAVVDRLREADVLRAGAPVVTTHHAHTGDATHCELEKALAPFGMEPGYDGMLIDF